MTSWLPLLLLLLVELRSFIECLCQSCQEESPPFLFKFLSASVCQVCVQFVEESIGRWRGSLVLQSRGPGRSRPNTVVVVVVVVVVVIVSLRWWWLLPRSLLTTTAATAAVATTGSSTQGNGPSAVSHAAVTAVASRTSLAVASATTPPSGIHDTVASTAWADSWGLALVRVVATFFVSPSSSAATAAAGLAVAITSNSPVLIG